MRLRIADRDAAGGAQEGEAQREHDGLAAAAYGAFSGVLPWIEVVARALQGQSEIAIDLPLQSLSRRIHGALGATSLFPRARARAREGRFRHPQVEVQPERTASDASPCSAKHMMPSEFERPNTLRTLDLAPSTAIMRPARRERFWSEVSKTRIPRAGAAP